MGLLFNIIGQAVLLLLSLLVHRYYFVFVPVGFVEIKYRRFRQKRAKFGTMYPGSRFLIPLAHERIPSSNSLGVVVPTSVETSNTIQSPGYARGQTAGGTLTLSIRFEYTFHVEDPDAFVEMEFSAIKLPEDMARERAYDIVVKAMGECHFRPLDTDSSASASHRSSHDAIAPNILEKCGNAANALNNKSAMHVTVVGITECGVIIPCSGIPKRIK